MKKVLFACALLFLGGCSSIQFFDASGDRCRKNDLILVAWQSCEKGERTVNANVNVNQPQHDPTVGQK